MYKCFFTGNPGIYKTISETKAALLAWRNAYAEEKVREASDSILDELIHWQDLWYQVHAEPFNWFGAVKALKVSKDFKPPFAQLQSDISSKVRLNSSKSGLDQLRPTSTNLNQPQPDGREG